jgi:hypothetical protein
MAERDATILRTETDLKAWRRALLTLRPTGTIPGVRFALPALSPNENYQHTLRGERLKRVCGCELGAFAGVFALFGLLLIFALPATRPGLSIAGIGMALAFVLAASVATRIAALVWARLELIRMASRLASAAAAATHPSRGGFYGTRL